MGLDDERAHLIDSVPSYQEAVTSSYNPTQNNPRNNTLIYFYTLRGPDLSVKILIEFLLSAGKKYLKFYNKSVKKRFFVR